jgi:hypothetical protein
MTNTAAVLGAAISNGFFHFRGYPYLDGAGNIYGSGASLTGVLHPGDSNTNLVNDANYVGSNAVNGLIAPYTNHQDRVDNPHTVTLEQVGGISSSTATGIAEAVVAPYTNQVTAESVAGVGAVTGTPWTVGAASSNLLSLVANGTCSIPYNASAPASDQQFYLAATQASVTFKATVDNWPTNRGWAIPVGYFNANETKWDAATIYSNMATISTTKWNHLVFSRGYGQTNFTVTGAAW